MAITEKDAEAAVEHMRDSADEIARAKALSSYLDSFTKVLKAQIMREHPKLPVSGQEREAMADQRMITHLEGKRVADHAFEKLKMEREAGMATLDYFRTWSANHRGLV